MKSGYVAIIGQPNVGKSTLVNRLIGEELSIVTPKPQTTRHKIVGILSRENFQAVFLDTPGFHKSDKLLNEAMLERVSESLEEADVIALMLDPKKNLDSIDREIFDKAKKAVRENNAKIIIVINKIDTVMDEPWGSLVERYWNMFEGLPTIAISAARGDGCLDLINKIVDMLPEGEPFFPPDDYTTQTSRFIAAEAIREQAMMELRQELPYQLAVVVEQFKEGETIRISATIIVEKDSQKAIVIGKKGAMIKKIGTAAREKLEGVFGQKIFLELFVRAEPGWTKDKFKIEEYVGK